MTLSSLNFQIEGIGFVFLQFLLDQFLSRPIQADSKHDIRWQLLISTEKRIPPQNFGSSCDCEISVLTIFNNIFLGIINCDKRICIWFFELSFNHFPSFVELEKHLLLDTPKLIVGFSQNVSGDRLRCVGTSHDI